MLKKNCSAVRHIKINVIASIFFFSNSVGRIKVAKTGKNNELNISIRYAPLKKRLFYIVAS